MDIIKKIHQIKFQHKQIKIQLKELKNLMKDFNQETYDIIYSQIFIKYFPKLPFNFKIKRTTDANKYFYYINSNLQEPFFTLEFITKGELKTPKLTFSDISISTPSFQGLLSETSKYQLSYIGKIYKHLYKNKDKILSTLNNIIYVRDQEKQENFSKHKPLFQKSQELVNEYQNLTFQHLTEFIKENKGCTFTPIIYSPLPPNQPKGVSLPPPYLILPASENSPKAVSNVYKIELIKSEDNYTEIALYDDWGGKWEYKENVSLTEYVKRYVANYAHRIKGFKMIRLGE